ncbi:hypothetical protein, partial [Streptomyces sp. NPDC002547]
MASVLRVRAVLTGVPVSGRVLRCEERHGGAGAGHAEGRHPGHILAVGAYGYCVFAADGGDELT